MAVTRPWLAVLDAFLTLSCVNISRHVVNGEILGVSLQLEDVLQNGLPEDILGQPEDTASVISTSPTLKVKDTRRQAASRRGGYNQTKFILLDSSISSNLEDASSKGLIQF